MSSKRRNNYDDTSLHQRDHRLYREEEREQHFKLINVEHEEEVFPDSFPVQVARVIVILIFRITTLSRSATSLK